MKVIIIDDEMVSAQGLSAMIEKLEPDWTVTGVFCDAEAALEACDWDAVQAALVDISMSGMDGLAFARELRGRGFETPVIFITAHAKFEYAQNALKQGAIDYLLKPVVHETLHIALNKAKKIEQEILQKEQDKEYIKKNMVVLREHFLNDILFSERDVSENEIIQKCTLYGLEGKTFTLMMFWSFKKKDFLRTHVRSRFVWAEDWYLYGMEFFFVLLLIANGGNAEKNRADIDRFLQMETVMQGQAKTGIVCLKELPFYYQQLWSNFQVGKDILQAYGQEEKESYLDEPESVLNLPNLSLPIIQAAQYILKNFQKQISLKIIAEAIYVHPTYLSNCFKKQTGTAVIDYINWCRINKAKELLKDPQNKIYWVMEQVGFSNQRYFSQVFKKMTKVTPTHYRHLAFIKQQENNMIGGRACPHKA